MPTDSILALERTRRQNDLLSGSAGVSVSVKFDFYLCFHSNFPKWHET
jgi:hypothetical protein